MSKLLMTKLNKQCIVKVRVLILNSVIYLKKKEDLEKGGDCREENNTFNQNILLNIVSIINTKPY